MKRILLSGGMVADGTGTPLRRADVVVNGAMIEDVISPGTLIDTSVEVMDCTGAVVAPGFIDRHAHSDFSAIAHPGCESKAAQGVTTEVAGNCGFSAFPIASGNAAEILKEAAVWSAKADWGDVDWTDVVGYRNRLEEARPAINIVPFVGHGSLRGAVSSYEDRPLSTEELEELERLTAESLNSGARGVSAGLIYPPGCYSDTGELLRVARVAAAKNVPMAMHIRGEGERLIEALEEAVTIGKETGVRVFVAHLKTYGPRNWGKIDKALETLAKARWEGVKLTADRYPYLASNTGLAAILPSWAQEGGDVAVVDRLRSKSLSTKILEEVASKHPNEGDYWNRVVVASVSKQEVTECVGKSIAEIARGWKIAPAEAALRILLLDHNSTSAIYFMMNQENLTRILKEPFVAVASDAAALPLDRTLVAGRPHPRAYGTFPRIFARHVRERKEFTLEEAVRKMTSLPADSLGLKDRGRIAAQTAADIVVFDPNAIEDKATFTEPVSGPTGIRLVMVNGVVVVKDGALTGERPGKVL